MARSIDISDFRHAIYSGQLILYPGDIIFVYDSRPAHSSTITHNIIRTCQRFKDHLEEHTHEDYETNTHRFVHLALVDHYRHIIHCIISGVQRTTLDAFLELEKNCSLYVSRCMDFNFINAMIGFAELFIARQVKYANIMQAIICIKHSCDPMDSVLPVDATCKRPHKQIERKAEIEQAIRTLPNKVSCSGLIAWIYNLTHFYLQTKGQLNKLMGGYVSQLDICPMGLYYAFKKFEVSAQEQWKLISAEHRTMYPQTAVTLPSMSHVLTIKG